MNYSPQDKYDFKLKDITYAYGMALGNAFTQAVSIFIAAGVPKVVENGVINLNAGNILKAVEGLRDMFFSSNQEELNRQIAAWVEFEGKKLKEELGIVEENKKTIKGMSPEYQALEGIHKSLDHLNMGDPEALKYNREQVDKAPLRKMTKEQENEEEGRGQMNVSMKEEQTRTERTSTS